MQKIAYLFYILLCSLPGMLLVSIPKEAHSSVLLEEEESSLSSASNQLSASHKMMKPKKWNFTIATQVQSTLDRDSGTSNQVRGAFYGIFSYRLPEKFRASAFFGTSKELQGQFRQELLNSWIRLGRPLFAAKNVSIFGGVRIHLPTNKLSHKVNSFYTRLSFAPTTSWRLNFLAPGLTLYMKNTYYQNFFKHNYSNSNSGKANIRHLFSNKLIVTYTGIKRVNLLASFANTSTWSATGVRSRDMFETRQEVSYQISHGPILSLGHFVGRNTFDHGGKNFNIAIFDVYDSNLYATIAYQF